MTRDEQIKQYCADQGFSYGACSSISSLKAYIATEAIKWADEHPNGSRIKWQTGEPKEEGLYIVTTLGGNVCIDEYYNKCGWVRIKEVCIIAWCKLSDIEPYKNKEKTK